MKAKQFAICDSDIGYLRMLQAYLQKKVWRILRS